MANGHAAVAIAPWFFQKSRRISPDYNYRPDKLSVHQQSVAGKTAVFTNQPNRETGKN
jgi:hypothetical protein